MNTQLALASFDMAGIRLRVEGDTLIANPRSAVTPRMADMLRRDKWKIIAALRGNELAEKQRELDLTESALRHQTEMLDRIFDAHHERVRCLNYEIAYLREEIGRPRSPAMPPDIREKAIRLCHPDRNGGSAAANEVTAWLISQREGR